MGWAEGRHAGAKGQVPDESVRQARELERCPEGLSAAASLGKGHIIESEPLALCRVDGAKAAGGEPPRDTARPDGKGGARPKEGKASAHTQGARGRRLHAL